MKKSSCSPRGQLFVVSLFFFGTVLANSGFCGHATIRVKVCGIERPSAEERLAIFEEAKTDAAAGGLINALLSKFKKQDLSGITVTLRSDAPPTKITKLTDKNGVVIFEKLYAHAKYELIAETDVLIDGKAVRAAARAFTYPSRWDMPLILRTDWVTLKGKVVNIDGNPAAGAHISLRPLFLGDAASARYDAYPQQDAVSEPDGSFIMPYVKPLDTDLAALYLISSNSVLSKVKFFYGLIYAKRPQVIGDGKPKLMIPLISENILIRARRDIAKANESNKEGYVIKEQENIRLPKSEGEVIFLPDIILDDDKPNPATVEVPTTKQ